MTNSRKIEKRPAISKITTAVELKRWYWLKTELAEHANKVGIKSTGAKFDILDRLAHFLETGEKVWPGDFQTIQHSKFNWHTEKLTPETLITDSYKNTQNVRRFFREHASSDFKFTIAFMEWMKSNIGETLEAAIQEYHSRRSLSCQSDYKTNIKPHNQFNQYTRDFLDDNPKMGMTDVRRVWALKRALPMENGRHIYERSDLKLR